MTLKRKLHSSWKAVFDEVAADIAVCVAGRESAYQPHVTNHYTGPDGVRHTVYGIFQLSDVHSTASWWPTNNGDPVSALFDPDYNSRCAMSLYKAVGWSPWVSTLKDCTKASVRNQI
jgi:hypothetical protein